MKNETQKGNVFSLIVTNCFLSFTVFISTTASFAADYEVQKEKDAEQIADKVLELGKEFESQIAGEKAGTENVPEMVNVEIDPESVKVDGQSSVGGDLESFEAERQDSGAADQEKTEVNKKEGVAPETASETTDMLKFVNADVITEDKDENKFYNTYIKGHLQIGTRTVLRRLTDDDSGHKGSSHGSGTFLGTIYGLDEIQNYAPIYFHMTYFFNKYIGIEMAYDKVEAETLAMGLYRGQHWSDLMNGREKTNGDVSLSGPSVSVVGRYPNSSSFTPFISLGLGFFSADYDSSAEWKYSRDGNIHMMSVDDEVALQLAAGTDWQFQKKWSLNASVQYTKATVDATFNSYDSRGEITQDPQAGEFPLDNIAFRLGVSYSF